MLQKLIEQLSQELGMEDVITCTEDHHYYLPFENNIEIEALELEKGYHC